MPWAAPSVRESQRCRHAPPGPSLASKMMKSLPGVRPRRWSSCAADRPAWPAPMMMAFTWLGMVGRGDEVVMSPTLENLGLSGFLHCCEYVGVVVVGAVEAGVSGG